MSIWHRLRDHLPQGRPSSAPDAPVHPDERGLGRGRGSETDRLATAIARHLAGRGTADELCQLFEHAHASAAWEALEALSENLTGTGWDRLAVTLERTAPVRAERERIASRWAWRRALAARRLALLGIESTREPLRRALERGPEIVTFNAALALARLGDGWTLDWLLAHPAATEGRSRRQLVSLLLRFGPSALTALRRTCGARTLSAPIHVAAVATLGIWRDRRATGLLVPVLEAGALEARVAAARSLGSIGDAGATDALLAALADPAWEVRAQAARALGSLRTGSAVAPLTAIAGDEAWWVRHNAIHALGWLGEAGWSALERLAAAAGGSDVADLAHEALEEATARHLARGEDRRVA